MKKETREYLCGERNAVKDEFVLSREKQGVAELVYVSLPEEKEPIYALWTKRQRRYRGKKETAPGEIAKPKHIGGKRPYIMLMQDKNDILNKLSMEAAGLVFKLLGGGFVEWNTCRIIDRRTKNPLTKAQMKDRYGLSAAKIRSLLEELTKNDVIRYDHKERSYFFNTQLAKKGACSYEN